MELKETLLAFAVTIIYAINIAHGYGSSDRIFLQDLKVLTLYKDRMTSARRSHSIPQLKCIGGSAGCHQFVPEVVQCYNRGSDGYDVQWECKTDMDNSYRFGKVEVSCEGYEYSDDPYVLKGSCGLEYSLDLTKEGHQKTGHQHHNYYDSNSNSYHKSQNKRGSWFGDLITLAIVGGIIYAIYKTCLNNDSNPAGHASAGGRDPYGHGPGGSAPPPPGFRQDYMPGGGCSSSYDSTYDSTHAHRRNNGFGSNFGGFWGGAATGGMLGYLLGGRNTGYGGYNRGYNRGWGGSSWGGGGSSWGNTGGFSAPSMSSSGTRTSSGFGGTKRR